MALLSNYISGGSGGGASGGAPSGKIVQMVTSEYVNNSAHITTTSSTTKVNSGLSATITPRDSSNNILVELIATMYRSGSNGMMTQLYRSGTGLTAGYLIDYTTNYNTDYYHGWSYVSGQDWGGMKNTWTDTDISASTGAITYTIYFNATNSVNVYLAHQGHQIYLKLTEFED